MTTSHANCDHLSTKAARAACRKVTTDRDAALLAQATALVDAYNAKGFYGHEFIFSSARKFPKIRTTNELAAAFAILAYFLPSEDEARNAYRRSNGYTITTNIHEMVSLTIRSFA